MEEKLEIDDLIVFAQLKFKLTHNPKKVEQLKNQILELVLKNIESKILQKDERLVDKMTFEINETIKQLEEKLVDAEVNHGENEIREALLNKALFYKKIGNKEEAIKSYEKTEPKTIALGQKIDLVFDLIRIGFAFNDLSMVKKNIEKAKVLVHEGGDWERRNRLKVYEGLYLMWVRKFERATQLFLDSISTFTCTELMDFQQFICYTVYLSMITLNRVELKQKIIDSSEVYSVLREQQLTDTYLTSLYTCQYKTFLRSLADLTDLLKTDRYFSDHANFYSREMRILAFSQFLESYKSIKMESMATQFGVSMVFLDNELSRFIASGRLHCRIDKVAKILETTRLDEKNDHYQKVVKLGDNILNRIHKLSRVTDL